MSTKLVIAGSFAPRLGTWLSEQGDADTVTITLRRDGPEHEALTCEAILRTGKTREHRIRERRTDRDPGWPGLPEEC